MGAWEAGGRASGLAEKGLPAEVAGNSPARVGVELVALGHTWREPGPFQPAALGAESSGKSGQWACPCGGGTLSYFHGGAKASACVSEQESEGCLLDARALAAIAGSFSP